MTMQPATDHELSHEDLDRVFNTIEIPACPAMVSLVMAEAQKDQPDLKKLAKLIAADIGMSAITIKLANSPLFRVGAPVTSVLKGLERLGTRNTVCVVVAVALRATMAGVSPAFIENFWNRTAALALAAGLIARRQYGVSPDAAYTYALFHDAGIPLMMRRFPDYDQVLKQCQATGQSIVVVEDERFSCTHPIVGALLVRNWGLPLQVSQAIRFHHDPEVYALPDQVLPGSAVSLVATTHIAEHLAHDADGEADIEVGSTLFSLALAHFGIGADELEELREDLLRARGES